MSQVVEYQRGSSPARLSGVEAGKLPSFNAERRRSPRVNALHLFISLALATIVTMTVNHEATKLNEPTLGNLFWHFTARPNCDAARAVGLDQATRGEPGYWLSHDLDRDGTACEQFGESPVFFQR